MNVYVWEHIVSLSNRTAQWMLTKLGRDEVLMAAHMMLRCFGHIRARADQGHSKTRSRGGGGSFS